MDRDGTIIKDKGFIKNVRDVEFYQFTFESLKELQEHFLLFVITNQSGIAKGLLTEKEVENVNDFILCQLKSKGIIIREFYYCPHAEGDNCECRKPSPYFINKATGKYSINILESYITGDHPSDIELAINSKGNGILVLTGHGKYHRNHFQNIQFNKIHICRNLKFASKMILKDL